MEEKKKEPHSFPHKTVLTSYIVMLDGWALILVARLSCGKGVISVFFFPSPKCLEPLVEMPAS